jgi:hypothetical protein
MTSSKSADAILNELAEKLIAIRDKYRETQNGSREAASEAVNVIREFIVSAPNLSGQGLEEPFLGIQVALFEAEAGKMHPLFEPTYRAPGEVPKKLLRDAVLENASALILSSLMYFGMGTKDAAKSVAKILERHDFYGGTKRAHGVAALDKRIIGWRVEIRKALRKSEFSFETQNYSDLADALTPSVVLMKFGVENGTLTRAEAIASLLRRLESFFTEPLPF